MKISHIIKEEMLSLQYENNFVFFSVKYFYLAAR